MKKISLIMLAVLLVLPSYAFAHLVSTRFGAVYTGISHPLSTLVHLIPWIALGLLAGLQGRLIARWIILLFPVSVFLGITFASFVSDLPHVGNINVLSLVLLGVLVAVNIKLGKTLFLFLVFFFGFTHGYDNAYTELSGKQWLLYSIGVCIAAYILITLITALTNLLVESQQWGVIAVRAAGSWIAAIGVIYTGFLYSSLYTAT